MLTWACAVGLLGLSASISCNSEFYYSRNIFRRSDDCNICFEKDCLTLDKARCDYYAEADSILLKDEEISGGFEDSTKRREVDDLMFEVVEKGLQNNMECIPYISRYTNCNKDNVCLGCKTCSCCPEGRWNCTLMQPCHAKDPPLNIDHRVLVMIMEAIIDHTPSRIAKRSVTDNPKEGVTVTLEQLSEWLYGAKPFSMTAKRLSDITLTTESTAIDDDERADEVINTVTEPSSRSPVLTTTEETKTTTNEDSDNIAFEEVLRNIAVEPKTDNRSILIDNKALDNGTNNNQTEFTFDYMIMDDEDNGTDEGASNKEFRNVINFMLDYDDVVTESTITEATEVVIDLLKTVGTINTNINVTEDYTHHNKVEDPNIFENMNEIIEHSAFNIMKRDVAGQLNITTPKILPTVTITVNTTNITTSANTTEDNTDLKNNILIPLNKIISDKMNELENLQKVKSDLLKFVKSDHHSDEKPKDHNITTNTYFSIYNVAVATGLDVDLRRADPSKYEKFMLKLKTDIFEVIRDIYAIRKYKNSNIPDDLKLLIHAMKMYVYKNKLLEKPKKDKLRRLRNFRRKMEETSKCDRLSLKDCLIQVIEVIDRDTPKFNALSPLSPAARKIMKHFIKSYYTNQLVIPGLRFHDPYYNLTNYLNSIGNKWQQLTTNLIGSTPFQSLYRMKLLHCTLTLDISKIDDAIGLIEFAHSRRMTVSLDRVNESTFDKIDAGLSAIHNKILMLIKYYTRTQESRETEQSRAVMKLNIETTTKPRKNVETTIKNLPNIPKKKKHSFIKHIRSLLKTSKHDIKELLRKKVPKSEIVRQLAKKRLDELSKKRYDEYEETMKRWQKNLELTSRLKRSVLDQFQTRIKNIIPRYLRHKVNPKIKENQKNATAEAERKADVRKKKRKEKRASRRERKSRKTTTPKSRKIAKPEVRARRVTKHATSQAPTPGHVEKNIH